MIIASAIVASNTKAVKLKAKAEAEGFNFGDIGGIANLAGGLVSAIPGAEDVGGAIGTAGNVVGAAGSGDIQGAITAGSQGASNIVANNVQDPAVA